MESKKTTKYRKISIFLAFFMASGIPLYADANHIISKYRNRDGEKVTVCTGDDCDCTKTNSENYKWYKPEPTVTNNSNVKRLEVTQTDGYTHTTYYNPENNVYYDNYSPNTQYTYYPQNYSQTYAQPTYVYSDPRVLGINTWNDPYYYDNSNYRYYSYDNNYRTNGYIDPYPGTARPHGEPAW